MQFFISDRFKDIIDITKLNSSLKRASCSAAFSASRFLSTSGKSDLIIDLAGETLQQEVHLQETYGFTRFQTIGRLNRDDLSAYVQLLNVAFLESQGALREARLLLDELMAEETPFSADALNRIALHLSVKGSFYSAPDVALYRSVFEAAKKHYQAISMLRKLWRVYGPTVWLTSYFNDLYFRFREVMTASDLMFVAAYFCESGDYNKSIKHALEAKKKRRETWSENRYMGLINLLVAEGFTSEQWAKTYSSLFRRVVENSPTLAQAFVEHRDTLAVVGNSPSIIGSRSAQLIDQSSFVIRFNSAETRHPYSLDVGTRTDAIVLNPDYSQTRRFWDRNSPHLVVSNGDLYASPHMGAKLHDIPDQYTIHFIPSHIDRHVTQALGASPSSGLKMLYWIYTLIGDLPRDRIFGFSMGDQPSGHSSSYSKPTPTKMPIVHDWAAEQAFLTSLLEQ